MKNRVITGFLIVFVLTVAFAIVGSAQQATSSESSLVSAVTVSPGDEMVVSCVNVLSVLPVDPKTVRIVCSVFTATPTPTRTQTQVPTLTPIPTSSPTRTQTLTPTRTSTNTAVSPQPSATKTATVVVPTVTQPGSVPPFLGAPLCSTHDPMVYHGLWDYARGCHYDHEHGFDIQNMGEQYFGEWGSLWGGEWMYPFESSPVENLPASQGGKHPGMKGIYNDQSMSMPPCGQWDAWDGGISDNCLVAVRGLIHVVGSILDFTTPIHSGFVEYYICHKDMTGCGVVRIGGLIDWGGVQSEPYGSARYRPIQGYNLPTFAIDFGAGVGRGLSYTFNTPNDIHYNSGEPYIFGRLYQDWALPQYRAGYVNPTDTWSSNDLDCNPLQGVPCNDGKNAYYHLLYAVADSWTLVDPVDMRTVHFLCEDDKPCKFNGSYTGINEAGVRVLPLMDGLDGAVDGFVTWHGWSDSYGTPLLTSSCVTPSINCVPMEFVHAPVGVAHMKTSDLCECYYQEHDILFNGQTSNWIKFPN